jgi:hypothetical protein
MSESVILTSIIDAFEDRDVATVDIPGAFMQTEMDDHVHMKLNIHIVELLTQAEPKSYRKYAMYE